MIFMQCFKLKQDSRLAGYIKLLDACIDKKVS